MLRNEGDKRTDHQNQLLAGYLALVAGYVNSAGFILIGSFTSHVTGNVGRLADDVALGHPGAAVLAGTMIAAFFVGSLLASMALESSLVAHRARLYGLLLLAEAGLLAAFYVLGRGLSADSPRLNDALALLLCAAMGLQNSLVTRLSGAVVRTTHLTGVVTDLGIEAARWFRFWRAHVGRRSGLRLVMGDSTPLLPHAPKSHLLLTILVAFMVGAAAGALLATGIQRLAMVVPFAMLVGAGAWALRSKDELVAPEQRK